MSDELPENIENKPKETTTDMQQMQQLIDEQVTPLKESVTSLKEENAALKEQVNKQSNDIEYYRKNLIANAEARQQSVRTISQLVGEHIAAGLEEAWRRSGHEKRLDLKEQWMEAAWNEIYRQTDKFKEVLNG